MMPGSADRIPLKMVGPSVFNRYNKIESRKAYNMKSENGWSVPTPGHKKIVCIDNSTVPFGREIINDENSSIIFTIFNQNIYEVTKEFRISKIGELQTSSTNISSVIANKQLVICDDGGQHIYIYSWKKEKEKTFKKEKLSFHPVHIIYHNGYYIAVDKETGYWRTSEVNDPLNWPVDLINNISLSNDRAIATVNLKSKGDLLFVFGKTIGVPYVNIKTIDDDTGAIFYYKKVTAFNLDYGCVSIGTIATNDEFIIWLGKNQKSGLSLLISEGGKAKSIDENGIDYKLSTIKHPEESFGFMYKEDGTLFYQITFYNNDDNVTFLYDFSNNHFDSLTDYDMNHHRARKVVYFNGSFYFIGVDDGCLYEMSNKYTTYDGVTIPRIIVTDHVRVISSLPFPLKYLTFPIEHVATNKENYFIDTSISVDGGESFGSIFRTEVSRKFEIFNIGLSDDFVFQFRFWTKGRVLVSDGYVE